MIIWYFLLNFRHYWKSCNGLSLCSSIFLLTSTRCFVKICSFAQLSCITPISQNSQDVTNSLSFKIFSHDLQSFVSISWIERGFSQESRQRTLTINKELWLILFILDCNLEPNFWCDTNTILCPFHGKVRLF